jgi:hypothetical protein
MLPAPGAGNLRLLSIFVNCSVLHNERDGIPVGDGGEFQQGA